MGWVRFDFYNGAFIMVRSTALIFTRILQYTRLTLLFQAVRTLAGMDTILISCTLAVQNLELCYMSNCFAILDFELVGFK